MGRELARFDLPDWEPVPPAYAAGVRGIYAYEAKHRSDRLATILGEIDGVQVIEHAGVRFLPDSDVPMFVPEGWKKAAPASVKRLGLLLSVLTTALVILPSRCTDRVWNAGWQGWLAMGGAILVLFVVSVLSDDRRERSMEARGIYVGGVFLFPDALLVRRAPTSVTLIEKREILRFVYQHLDNDSAHANATHAVVACEGGESKIAVVQHRDATRLMEEWRRAETPRPGEAPRT